MIGGTENDQLFARARALDNQHKKIRGYRDLSEEEIQAMNILKEAGSVLEAVLERVEALPVDLDMRWWAIGKTDLQKGLMAVTRAVAQPESF